MEDSTLSSDSESDSSMNLVMDLSPIRPPDSLEESQEEDFNCLDLDSQCSKGILTTIAVEPVASGFLGSSQSPSFDKDSASKSTSLQGDDNENLSSDADGEFIVVSREESQGSSDADDTRTSSCDNTAAGSDGNECNREPNGTSNSDSNISQTNDDVNSIHENGCLNGDSASETTRSSSTNGDSSHSTLNVNSTCQSDSGPGQVILTSTSLFSESSVIPVTKSVESVPAVSLLVSAATASTAANSTVDDLRPSNSVVVSNTVDKNVSNDTSSSLKHSGYSQDTIDKESTGVVTSYSDSAIDGSTAAAADISNKVNCKAVLPDKAWVDPTQPAFAPICVTPLSSATCVSQPDFIVSSQGRTSVTLSGCIEPSSTTLCPPVSAPLPQIAGVNQNSSNSLFIPIGSNKQSTSITSSGTFRLVCSAANEDSGKNLYTWTKRALASVQTTANSSPSSQTFQFSSSYLPSDAVKKTGPTSLLRVNDRKPEFTPVSSKMSVLLNNECLSDKKYVPKPPPEKLHMGHRGTYKCSHCCMCYNTHIGYHEHLSRRTMKIQYSCPYCKYILTTYNKCAFKQVVTYHECCKRNPIKLDSCSIDVIQTSEMGVHYLGLKKKSGSGSESPCMSVDSAENTEKVNMEDEEVFEELPEALQPLVNNVLKKKTSNKQSLPSMNIFLELQILTNFCMECKAYFNTKSGLQQHFVPKSKNHLSMECNLCTTVLPTECAYTAHMRIHDCKEPFVCPECGDCMFQSRDLFLKHVKQVCYHFSRKSTWLCPLCEEKFDMQEYLKGHILDVHAETYNKCSLCPIAFRSQEAFSVHNHAKHTGNAHIRKMAKCPFCSMAEPLDANSNHLLVHLDEFKMQKGHSYSYTCPKCPLVFNLKGALTLHVKSYHKEIFIKGEMCGICGTECTWLHILASHVLKEHKVIFKKMRTKAIENLVVLICPHCARVSRSQASSKLHQAKCTHRPMNKELLIPQTAASPESSVKDVSEKNSLSPSKSSLSPPPEAEEAAKEMPKESSVLDENYQFECTKCQIAFEQKMIYDRHMARHDFIQRMKSSKRNSEPTSPGPLKKIKMEPGTENEQPPGENVARQAQIQKVSKSKEIQKDESPEPQFPCSECDHVYFEEEELENHLKTEHDIAPRFPCYLCGDIYLSKELLDDHVQRKHGGKVAKKNYTCCLCKDKGVIKTYASRKNLTTHLKSHRPPKAAFKDLISKSLNVVKIEDDADGSSLNGGDSPKGPKPKRVKSVDDKLYTCAKCEFSSCERGVFLQHIVKHKREDTLQCEDCGLCFLALPTLERHLVAVHQVSDITAYLAESQIKEDELKPLPDVDLSKLAPHKQTPKSNGTTKKPKIEKFNPEDVKDPLQCQVCHKVFENFTILKKHIRNHGMAFVQSRRHSSIIS